MKKLIQMKLAFQMELLFYSKIIKKLTITKLTN